MPHEREHEREPPELIRRLAERRERHRQRSRPYRALVVVAGFTITLAGLVLLVTPGPALVVIPIGLALLALEFAWAERMLHYAIRRADDAKRRAESSSRTERALGTVATLLTIAAIVTAAWVWDIPLLPV
jgi:uncharacterized protein (TIGR02611 family)